MSSYSRGAKKPQVYDVSKDVMSRVYTIIYEMYPDHSHNLLQVWSGDRMAVNAFPDVSSGTSRMRCWRALNKIRLALEDDATLQRLLGEQKMVEAVMR